ncbi:MAG: hypothetical protein AABY22_26725 [Nanoarchaeota archaeon]
MKRGKLVSSSGLIALIGVLIGIYFLYPTITGNLVANTTKTSSALIGAVCLVIGIFAGYKAIKN